MPGLTPMSLLERLVNSCAIACGWACLGLGALTRYDIVARRLLGHSVQGVDEIGGYVLAVTAAVGFASALLHRMHTRIDLVLTRLPTGGQAFLNAVSSLALAGFAAFMAWKAVGTLLESLEFGSRASTPLQTPLWIPQGLWVFGITLFAVIATTMAAHAVWLLLRGKAAALNAAYGPPTLNEEIEESLAQTRPEPLNLSPEGASK